MFCPIAKTSIFELPVVMVVKNLPISSFLGSTYPLSWNFNLCGNLFDSEIEELGSLMSSLACLHLTPFVLDLRVWFLSFLGLFTVKSFFLVLSHLSDSSLAFPTNLFGNLKSLLRSSPFFG